jgi:FkbM family methyltransferase
MPGFQTHHQICMNLSIKELENILSDTLETCRAEAPLPNAVALYGAGSIGRECLLLLQSKGVVVRYVLDAKSTLTQLEGVPVVKPDDAAITAAEKHQLPVIISIFNAHVSMVDVTEIIRQAGWSHVTGFLHFHRKHATCLGDRYWLTHPSFYHIQQPGWRSGADLWDDAESTALYHKILKFRFTGDDAEAPLPQIDEQYCPATIPRWPQNLRLVDCGAFDGDTLEGFGPRGYCLEALAAFEPDPANLAILSRKLPALAPEASPAALWPCGVFSTTTQLKFNSGHGAGSAISATGDTVIQCVALDDALTGFKPNLIKMDVEGAEYAALLGARRTIEQNRPGLAICLYHSPAHLWQIPALIESWDLGYRFFLRAHYYNGFDLVMYAVSSNRL